MTDIINVRGRSPNSGIVDRPQEGTGGEPVPMTDAERYRLYMTIDVEEAKAFRSKKIMELIQCGHSNIEIGEHFNVGVSTISTWRREMKDALAVSLAAESLSDFTSGINSHHDRILEVTTNTIVNGSERNQSFAIKAQLETLKQKIGFAKDLGLLDGGVKEIRQTNGEGSSEQFSVLEDMFSRAQEEFGSVLSDNE